MAQIPQDERPTFALAVLLVIMTIAAVVALIYNGANAPFYVLGAITLILGFYVTYTIPKAERQAARRKR